MSIHTAVHSSLKKLTDKGEGSIESHHIEHLDDGTFIHSIRKKSNGNKAYESGGGEDRHTHSSVRKLTSCIKECHSGKVED